MIRRSFAFELVAGLFVLVGGVLLVCAQKGGASPAPSGTSSGSSASVVGRVRFEGQRPEPTRITMSTDPTCAKLHSGPTASDEFVIGGDGGLGNVVVFVSSGLAGKTFDVPVEPVVEEQKGCMYKPHVLALQAGQKLKIVNSDNTLHNIHPIPANNREWNKAEPAGSVLEEAFAREEIAIPVKCNVHPWMRSYIAVFKHPYFAVTGKDGAFDLRNLPPGEYTLKAWHEKFGTMTQTVTIASGEMKKIDFVFKNQSR